jgi:hypothetical protein
MVQDSDGPYEPPPAVWNLLKELSNFRVGRGIYLVILANPWTRPELQLGSPNDRRPAGQTMGSWPKLFMLKEKEGNAI